jgi:hypothetical protein
MEFNAFKEWVFLGVITSGTYILWQLKQSVEHLNCKIAVIIEKIDTHDKRITKLEDKIET